MSPGHALTTGNKRSHETLKLKSCPWQGNIVQQMILLSYNWYINIVHSYQIVDAAARTNSPKTTQTIRYKVACTGLFFLQAALYVGRKTFPAEKLVARTFWNIVFIPFLPVALTILRLFFQHTASSFFLVTLLSFAVGRKAKIKFRQTFVPRLAKFTVSPYAFNAKFHMHQTVFWLSVLLTVTN